jgi:hypothetical protein
MENNTDIEAPPSHMLKVYNIISNRGIIRKKLAGKIGEN